MDDAQITQVAISDSEVIEVARAVVDRLAPEELAVFGSVADAWVSAPAGRRKRAPGAAVGFGVEAVLLSQLVFPIITGALGDVLGASWSDRVKPKRKAARAAITAPAAGGEAGPGADPALPLTAAQAQSVRDACLRHATALGLPPARAELLADAVLGSVRPVAGA
jgi:hypothetical protein